MLRKTIVTMASIVALTGTAYAWDVNVSVTPANSAEIGGGTIGRNSFSSEIAEKAFTVTAKTGYDLKKVVVDGVVKSSDISENSFSTTFTSTKSHKLAAVLAVKTFDITASNPTVGGVAAGVFSPVKALKAKYGTSRAFSIVPKKGFEISAVTDNGTPVTVYRDRAATTPVSVAELAANPANSPVYVVLSSLAADHALAATMQVAQPVQARISPNTTQSKEWTYFKYNNDDHKLVFSAAKSTATAGIASYAWSLEPSTAGTLSTPNAKTVAFKANGGGESTLTLTVTDADGVTDTASVKINVTGDLRTSECTFCHGIRAKDKPLMAKFTSSVHATKDVTCSSCHTHHATEPSDLTVAQAACTTCHQNSTQQIYSQWKDGHHGSAEGHTTGLCQRCHATEGAIVGATVGWTGSYDNVLKPYSSTIWRNNKPAASNNGISCRACHDEHGGGLRTINTIVNGQVVAWDPNQNGVKDQYDVCTSCHSLTNNSGAVTDMYHEKSSINVTRMVADSHYDDPATGVGLATNVVEGYVVRKNSVNPCADCHNLHTADLTKQEEWAESAHAGKISTKKLEAAKVQSVIWWNAQPANATNQATLWSDIKSNRTVLENFNRNAAGVAFYKTVGALDDHDGNAWTHYNWDKTLKADGTNDRGACQRCHTATGAANFMNNPAAYDATGNGNDFSHLAGWSKATGSNQQELLYCWGCHNDTQSGSLRTPGAITETYTPATTGAPAAVVTYPDLGKSNVCMSCHIGREVGQTIANDTDADGVRSFINSHYLAAGATIFNESGYEFAGQTYNNLGYHKNVGINNTFNTGTSGPCVTCHMSGEKSHTFEVSASSPACANCHASLTSEALTISKESFEVAMNGLKAALEGKGIYFKDAHPYFYQADQTTAFTNWAGVYGIDKWKDVMGAAFNYNLLEHDPGAYAHNRGYALKLITDSIDFITDGVIDGNGIPADVKAAVAAKEFAELTGHPTAATASTTKEACSTCHAPGAHYGGAPTNGTATGGTSKTQWVTQGLVCADCHAPDANGAQNRDWAEGGHGHVSNEDDNAFVHYDWKARTNDGTRSNSNCDRCHTAYGFIKFANQTTGMTRLRLVSGQPNAVLACVGCHKDIKTGELRTDATPAGMTAPLSEGYKALFVQTGSPAVPNAEIQFPSFKNSNICIPCHSGRTTEKIVKDTFALRNWTTATTGFYQHAANMGQTFIGTGAFEYVPGNFSSLPKHHNNIGMAEGNDNGPCASCHNPHSLEVKNFEGCSVQYCHGTGFGQVDVDRAKGNFEAAVKVLENLVTTKIGPLFVVPGTPIATERAAVRWAAGTGDPAVAVKNYGAWYNWHILTNADKAAFAHNPAYARQILVDTIDYLDDGLNNGTYSNAIYASSAVTAGEKAQAAAIVTAQGCNGCHNATITSTPHNQGAANGTLAAYVSSRSLCTDCHAPSQYHYTSSQQNKDFAASGHGDVTAEPWFGGTGHDWKNSATCNACHSATGFRKFVASGYTDATAWGAGDTSANEVASCKACHSDSKDFKGSVVSVTGYQAGMGGFGSAAVSKTDFADVGKSGVCVPCHAGREDGKTIKALETAGNNFTNVGFKNPHYLAAAGVFYGKGGFQFYTSGVRYNTYGAAGKIGRTANWSHGKIGMDNFTAAKLRFDSVTTSKNNVGIVRGTGNNGQCVGCHVGPESTHTFDAFKTMDATWGTNATGAKGCYGCHNSEDMREVAEDELLLFNRGMDFFKFTLAQNNIFYTDAYPYFNNAGGTALKNWTQSAAPAVGPVAGTGAQNMGAAMNFKLLKAEKGAHVHNRAFSRALIADSIVYLQNGSVGNRSVSSADPNAIMNFTNYSTALAAAPDGNPKSISNLKSWILRLSSGKYTRR